MANNEDETRSEFFTAPLVQLVDTDPKLLSPEGLAQYLDRLRMLKNNSATRKAATNQGPKKPRADKKPSGGIDLTGLL